MGVDSPALGVSLADVQRPVREELDAVVGELRQIIAADFGLIGEVNAHLLRMRGKLFRPTLVFLAHQACELDDPRVVKLGSVVELIHIATLVHDDSVDHSAKRRGLPTVNEMFTHQTSVIMGDYLYSRAMMELVRLRDMEALDILARITNKMTIGEMRQLTAHDHLEYSEDEYDLLINCKTASLFAGACEIGGLTGDGAHRTALRTFGEALGMAFQIVDDVLDYTESEEVTGKPSGHDLREHKVTLPLIAALREMTPSERDRVAALFAAETPALETIVGIVNLVRERGGIAYALGKARAFAEQAEAELERLPTGEARETLRATVTYAVERKK